jgi:iron complex outermembrane receptor protein
MHFKPGASGLLGVSQVGNDPHFRASLRSLLNISPTLSVDATVSYTGRRPNPALPSLTEMDLAVNWRVRENMQFYLAGRNLLHEEHVEYSPGDAIRRSVTAGARWRF